MAFQGATNESEPLPPLLLAMLAYTNMHSHKTNDLPKIILSTFKGLQSIAIHRQINLLKIGSNYFISHHKLNFHENMDTD